MEFKKYKWNCEVFSSPSSLAEFINKKELGPNEFKIVTEPRRFGFEGGSYYTLFYLSYI